MSLTYTPPANIDLSEVVTLLPAHKQKQELKPDTPVICINRGPHELRDQWDADPYVIPPNARFQVAYAAAKHFQQRLIVPGTRNPNVHDASAPMYVSWIGILGVDPEEACTPFTVDQLAYFGESVEGLNRKAMPGYDRDVQVRSTSEMARSLDGLGIVASAGARASSGGVSQELVGGSDENREAAMAPVEGSDARAEFAKAAATGWTQPEEGSIPDHSAPVPAEARRTAARRR